MNFRALLRRAFPYIVIGIGGFALAYVVIFVFVLPTKIVPPAPQPYAAARAQEPIRPIDTGVTQTIAPPAEPPPVTARIIDAPPQDTVPILTPNLIGMSLPDARGVLNGLRLRSAVTRDTSSFQPPNTVLRQSPLPDSLILVRGTVTLTVSYFPPDTASDTMRLGAIATTPDTAPNTAEIDSLLLPNTLHPK